MNDAVAYEHRPVPKAPRVLDFSGRRGGGEEVWLLECQITGPCAIILEDNLAHQSLNFQLDAGVAGGDVI
jgi:hypothetical protein